MSGTITMEGLLRQLDAAIAQRDAMREALERIGGDPYVALPAMDAHTIARDALHRAGTKNITVQAGDGVDRDASKIELPRRASPEEVERVYREFWIPTLTEERIDDAPGDRPTMAEVEAIHFAVRCELYDFYTLLQNVPRVYMEVTGGMVSKPNTHAVIGLHEEHVNNLIANAEEDWELEHGIGEGEAEESAPQPEARSCKTCATKRCGTCGAHSNREPAASDGKGEAQ